MLRYFENLARALLNQPYGDMDQLQGRVLSDHAVDEGNGS